MYEKRDALRHGAMALAIAMASGLSGCGGGSNVKPSTPPPATAPPPAPAPAPAPAPQPALDAHLTLIHARQAHQAGYSGDGVVIGVVDTGINTQHPALQGRVLHSKTYLDCTVNNCDKNDVVGHGTMVAEVAAGKTFGSWPGGVAPDADLESVRIIQDKEPEDDGSGHGNKVEAADAAFFRDYLNPYLASRNVDIVNNSWGGLYFDPAKVQAVADAFGDAYRPLVTTHDALVVFAAGNSSFANPSDLASLPEWEPDLERGWLVAVALDSLHPTKLADYSNQCGRTADYCLAAPGNVVVPGPYEGYQDDAGWNEYVVKGTSFAAPEVSGAAALVWQAFPYFDNDMVRQTLLSTATDLGQPGVDSTFGWGALDVGKAVKGPAQFAWGDVTADFDTITSTWSNDISGAGGLVKDGTGTLVLTGHDIYTGGTLIKHGVLRAKSLVGTVTVGAGGKLDGLGIVDALHNEGIVSVHGHDTQVASYVQESTGTLAISLGARLVANGTAELHGGTLEVTGAEPGYTASTRSVVLKAGASLTGSFGQLVKDQGVVFLSNTIHYDYPNGEVWLDTTGLNVTVAAQGSGVHYTRASMESAERVQGAFEGLNASIASGTLDTVSDDFVRNAGAFQHSPSLRAAQASLKSLSGQLHAASAGMTLRNIDATGRALADRLEKLAASSDRHHVWTRTLKLDGSMARAGYADVDYRLDGWLVGDDVRVGRHALAGFAFSQSRGMTRLASRFDRNHSRNVSGMFYAAWAGRRWYAHGRVGMGSYHQNMSRTLLLGRSYQGVWTDYDGHYNVVRGESGMHFGVGGNLRLTPFAALEYDRVARQDFVEHGAGGFGLRADNQVVSRWQSGVGVKLASAWQFSGGRSLSLDARAEWRRTLSASGAVFDASFVGFEQWRTLSGVGLSRRSAVFGVDLAARPSAHSRFKLGGEYLIGDRGHATVASVSFAFAF